MRHLLFAFALSTCLGCQSRSFDDAAEPLDGQQAASENVAETHSRVLRENESYLAQESRDDSWAPGREQQIESELRDIEGLTQVAAECRAKLCRVLLTFKDGAGQSHFIKVAQYEPSHHLFEGSVSTMLKHTSETTSVWWISRPGFSFPGSAGVPKAIRKL